QGDAHRDLRSGSPAFGRAAHRSLLACAFTGARGLPWGRPTATGADARRQDPIWSRARRQKARAPVEACYRGAGNCAVRFRHVVLAFMVPLLLGTVVATVGAVTIVLDRSARRELAAELDRSRQGFEQLTADRELLYRSESRVVAEEPRLKAVVATEDVTHETVLGVASELRRALQADIFLIADGHGRLLADTANSEAAGDDVTGLPLIARA